MAYLKTGGRGFTCKNMKAPSSGGGGGGTNYAQFTPGHYVLLNMNQGTRVNNVITGGVTSYTTALGEIKARPALQGLQCRLYWNQIEYNKAVNANDYDFSIVDNWLNTLGNESTSGVGKKLIILFSTQVSAGGHAANAAHVCPPYMLSTTADKMGPGSDGIDYDGGQWGYNGAAVDGYRLRIANDNVLARFNLMLTALASFIRNHPNYHVFESLTFTETADGNAAAGWTEPSLSTTMVNLLAATMTFDAGVPERMTHMMINHPRSTATAENINYLTSRLAENKLGFGSPDVFWDKADLWNPPDANGRYNGALYQQARYDGAKIAGVQAQDQWCTTFPGGGDSSVCPAPGHVPTFLENYNNVVNIIGAHYCIWQRATEQDPNNPGQQLYQTMLQFFNTARPLNTTRPTIWKTY